MTDKERIAKLESALKLAAREYLGNIEHEGCCDFCPAVDADRECNDNDCIQSVVNMWLEHYPAENSDKPEHDPVNHPSYYTQGGIETIDYIESHNLNFCRGNACKYISRAGDKDPAKEIEDLQKAVWYLNHEISRLEKEAAGNGGDD